MWSDHFPAAEKPPATISPCKTKGLWSEIFPAAEEPSPPPPPPRHERCVICPKCNAASCRLLTSSTTQNPGRQFYICPAPALDHKFFKWADEVEPHEFIDVPYCGGCMAGVCRVRKETSGPNAGRILFMCRIKEGEGSCGFKVWKDKLEVSSTTQANERISLFQSTTSNSNSTSPANIDLVDENKQSDEVAEYESPPVIDNSSDLQCVGVTSTNKDQLQCHKLSVSLSRLNKRSRDSDLEDVSSPLDSSSAVQNKTLENSGDSITLTKNLLRVKSPLFKPGQDELPGNKPFHITLDAPSCSGETKIGNSMSKSISKVFGEAGEHLQNDLLTLLETMDVKEHKAMCEAAEATFAALDRLLFNHQEFKKRAKEFIHCAMLLSEIEQSISPENDSYQKLIDHCSSEKTRLDEINSVHTKVLDNVASNYKRLKDVQEEISSTRDWLFQIEAELSCCEVEMRNMEHELEKISEKKEVLEGNYMIASKELEESQKLREKKEADRNAAEAAFDRARALLRG